jgi:hypothetical protein
MATLSRQLAAVAHPLTGAPADYEPLLALIGNAHFVLLGEASHGTHEFYRERAQITKRLIHEKGFTASRRGRVYNNGSHASVRPGPSCSAPRPRAVPASSNACVHSGSKGHARRPGRSPRRAIYLPVSKVVRPRGAAPLIEGVSQSERCLSFHNTLSAIDMCAFCSREPVHCSSHLSTIRNFSVYGIEIAS